MEEGGLAFIGESPLREADRIRKWGCSRGYLCTRVNYCRKDCFLLILLVCLLYLAVKWRCRCIDIRMQTYAHTLTHTYIHTYLNERYRDTETGGYEKNVCVCPSDCVSE